MQPSVESQASQALHPKPQSPGGTPTAREARAGEAAHVQHWIRGQVRDVAGEPVPGSRVEAIEEKETGVPEHLSTETDAQGHFALSNLKPSAYTLVAKHEQTCSELTQVALDKLPFRDGLVLVLQEGSIEGSLTTPEGTPLEGFRVSTRPVAEQVQADRTWWRRRDLMDANATTDAHGHFSLAPLQPGAYELSASKKDDPAYTRYLHPTREKVLAHTGDKNVRLVLPSRGGIRGQVRLEGRDPPGPFSVILTDAQRFNAFDIPGRFGGEDGTFSLQEVPQGFYRVFIAGKNFRQQKEPALVKGGAITDLGIIAVRAGRKISGRVLGEEGAVAGALVRVGEHFEGAGRGGDEPSQPWMNDNRWTHSDDSGRYEIQGLSEKSRFIMAEHPRWGVSQIREVPAGSADQDMDLRLRPSARIFGRVSRDEKGMPGVRLILMGTQDKTFMQIQKTSGDGNFSFEGLSPGDYSLSAHEAKFLPQNFDGQKLSLKAGQHMRHDIDLGPPGHTLEVLLQMRPEDGDTTFHVFKIRGAVQASTARELKPHKTFDGNGFEIAWIRPQAGNVARFFNVGDGTVTVCVQPWYRASEARHAGDSVPVKCKSLVLRPDKPDAQIEIQWP